VQKKSRRVQHRYKPCFDKLFTLIHQQCGLARFKAGNELDERLANEWENNETEHIENEMERVCVRTSCGELFEQCRVGDVCFCLHQVSELVRVVPDFTQYK